MKFLRAFFVLCIFSSTFILAESEIRMRGIENRVSDLEAHRDRPLSQITPCAGPRVKDGMDLALFADFIYWTARLDTLTYAKTGFGDITGQQNPNKGDVQSVDWSWDPGFKVGLGWSFCHGCWDMTLQYTWFYTNVGDSKRSHFLQPGFTILPPSNAFNIPSFERAHAHFDLHYQVGDLELGRNYYVSRTLKLRPFIGIKGTWQKQDYNVFYETVNVLNTVFDYKARFDQSIWGLGMRAGLKTSWQFSKYIGLYGDVAFTGIWLHYDTDRKDTFGAVVNNQQVGNEITTVNIQDHLRLIKPVLEFAIGLRGETYFACGRYHFLIQAGWESQIWINQTLYINLRDHFDRFDLNLQGFTAKIRFDF